MSSGLSHIGRIHADKTAREFSVPHVVLIAIGVICSALSSGCKDAKAMSDPLLGHTAGEQRCFSPGHGVNIEFRWAPGGRFLMGSPVDEPGRSLGENQTWIQIKDGFWIAERETTVSVWHKVMGDEPDMKNRDASLPVSSVSWHDCREFLARLPSPGAGWRYELPTEAQWEYACRAGGKSVASRNLAELGWIDINSGGRSRPVGMKPANAWSLRDMHGNVAEWCRDTVGAQGAERPIRGGSWDSDLSARAAARNSGTPYLKINRVGFRLVLVREQKPMGVTTASLLSNH